MRPLRIMSIFGTRPEAVKMGPIIKELELTPQVESLVAVTAQHRQMLDQVLELFDIVPDVDLNLMQEDQSIAEITAAMFIHLDPVLRKFSPDWVLVQGDTTTVMAASLAAYYRRIRVGHVEAGLRTGDKWQPFPEEINRKIAGLVADLHFAPTEQSRQNLLREGIPPTHVIVTGNPVIDALNQFSMRPPTQEVNAIFNQLKINSAPSGENNAQGTRRVILVTAHRRENFGEPLQNICRALIQLAETYQDDICVVYPVHLNPNIKKTVHEMLEDQPNIYLLPPLDYLPLVQLMKRAALVLTDSGGIQEEAPGLGVPVLVLRQVTERPEGINAGTVKLVGTNTDAIVSEARQLLDDPVKYAKMSQAVNPYGDGHASERIVRSIIDYGNAGEIALNRVKFDA